MDDEHWMRLAIVEAERASSLEEVPVGAVVVREDLILGRGYNRRETDRDPTAHAEILALRDAAEAHGSWRLDGVTMVVTLEPCLMCAGALVAARVAKVVFGAADPKAGACGSLYNFAVDPRLNHQVEVVAGVRAAEAGRLLTDFFSMRR